ncbi:DEAD/DEAH box helicase [Candidatus Puniceispirillum marinum]|uniref:Helicase ATP-binding domain-containing protein n=1 Tax=Puniceispirillum marinum (strain IMCC1322) TaxID=488538 RepID=D5BNI0_PUNMI|nr:type ISP restriction/modification enzyme [Candidatus Puniceispirillum marinum]ADE38247.1 hypothetical protein SAR116_0004 [Candidatus Puniceispirillum marinum IMCC1322]
MTTFNDVLDALRAQARNTREQGTLFEDLMEAILPQLPDAGFEEVWSWKAWPDRHAQTGMNAQDVGIDLVGKREGEDGFCAIQCKFYDPDTSIAESDLGTFFTQSGKDAFSSRLIITTTDRWTKHAETAIRHQDKPTNRMRMADLAELAIDWDIHKPKQTKLDITKYTLNGRQKEARDAVITGLKDNDRGKLIMACGTGKTLTSLHIAEMMIEGTGHVLFMVPSISLLAQSLHEWSFQRRKDHRYIAVCSDTKVDRTSEDSAVEDLIFPASTNAHSVAHALRQKANRMTVVFCTYQSIDIIHQAQQMGAPAFDLVICDEAHRTTGIDRANLAKGKTSPFVRVHDGDYLKAAKRLYMTATPRIYTDHSKQKADDQNIGIYSMDDEAEFGTVLYRLSFSDAITEGLLSDYRVIVLNMSESHVSQTMQDAISDKNELSVDDAAKIVGCYNALRNRPEESDSKKLKRAVSFSSTIKKSKHVRDHFQAVVDKMDEQEHDGFTCQVDHVDGTNTALERKNKLDWLREPAGANEHGEICRILSNAKCLTEGVDVPALDAAIFMNPRKSQVDVVQAVGRVMRKAEGKDYGYVILPIVIPLGKTPEEALDDNETYAVVWEILRALRSHDDRLTNMISKLDLNATKPDFIQVIGGDAWDDQDSEKVKDGFQFGLDLGEEFRDAIYAKLVERVGDRQYWETWARDVAHIHELLITRITDLCASNPALQARFDGFVTSLQADINDNVDAGEAVSILAQHMITRPIFDALFDHYDFAGLNPVSQSLDMMLAELAPFGLENELRGMDRFYASVRDRVTGIDNAAARQKIVIELYEKFFKTAFPKVSESLGIAYTPVEIVDFILHSADHVLRTQFGRGIGDEDVHVIDPFTGTGTFINRLISNPALIPDEKLPHKFAHEIHANEMLLMAYYIASINIEEAYHVRMSKANGGAGGGAKTGGDYMPFPGIVLTDTFQLYERALSRQDDMDSHFMPDNNERRNRQINAPIRVIIGNPPYSAGQKSQNDANQNLTYPNLDESIRSTYAAQSTATNKNALYDSYIRAFKWASDRIGDEGVIALVSGAAWIDRPFADGMRKSLAEEFSSIHIFHLRGDIRKNMLSKGAAREGENVFGQASMTGIAITILTKQAGHVGDCAIYHHDIGDDLRRDDKLAKIADARSIAGLDWQTIIPNPEGDWLNQRDPAFQKLIALGSKDVKSRKVIAPDTVFKVYSGGVKTNRDPWAYNISQQKLVDNMQAMVGFYNEQLADFQAAKQNHSDLKAADFISNDPTKISWSRSLVADIGKLKSLIFSQQHITSSQYRPFTREYLYFDRRLNDMVYRMPSIFPKPDNENRVIAVTGVGSRSGFSCLIADCVPNLHYLDSGQCFPRWTFDEDGRNRQDNIPNEAVRRFRAHYADESITGDDIFDYVYGILHAPDYRTTFANDLTKALPRIPMAPDFRAFAKAGKQLGALHLNYETGDEYGLNILVDGDIALGDILLDDADYHVQKMRWASKTDKTAIRYNNRITLAGIPADALRYVVSGKPALDWVIDRYCIKTDKASGITNDANDWITEQIANGGNEGGAPDALIRLIQRVTHLSVETMKIVDNLPPSLEE